MRIIYGSDKDMFKQLNKLKDKARRVLEDLAGTLDEQLVPRRQPIPVRVPVNKPRARPFSRNFSRDFTSSAIKNTDVFAQSTSFRELGLLGGDRTGTQGVIDAFLGTGTAFGVQSTKIGTSLFQLSQASKASQASPFSQLYKGFLSPSLSQKLSSHYRSQLVNSTFKPNFLKVMTSFTVVKDMSKYFNDLTKRYDNLGVKLMINNPLAIANTSVYTAIDAMEQKIHQLNVTLNSLKELAKIGDLPISTTPSHISVDFDLTKSELSNLLADNQINHIPMVENVNVGLLNQLNNDFHRDSYTRDPYTTDPYTNQYINSNNINYDQMTSHMQHTTTIPIVKPGLNTYTINTSDMSGGN